MVSFSPHQRAQMLVAGAGLGLRKAVQKIKKDLKLDISHMGLQKLRRRFKAGGGITRAGGQGRHRKTTVRDDRLLLRITRNNRSKTSAQLLTASGVPFVLFLVRPGLRITRRTVVNRLHEVGIKLRKRSVSSFRNPRRGRECFGEWST